MNAFLYLHLYKSPVLETKYHKHFSLSEIAKINSAFLYAYIAHFGQMRANETPYIDHPVRMTKILMDRFHIYDVELMLTLIFHDVDEESWLLFVSETIGIWFGLKQKHNISMLTKTPENKETFLLAILICGIWRIILGKLIDRIDNMETLEGLGIDFQRKQGEETRKYFLDLCFALEKVMPEKYKHVPMLIHDRLVVLCEQYGC